MKSLKINALAAIIVRILNILFPLITGPYIARTLSKESISTFDTANTLTQLFIPFATFGVYTYGVRAISKVKNNKNKINILFSELFILSIFSTLLTSLIYYLYILNFLDNNLLYVYSILGLQIIFQFISIEWVNEAFENYTFILYKTIFVRITMFIIIFSYIKSPEDVIPYVTIMTVAELLNMIISFIWIKKEVKIVKVNFKNIIRLISPLFTIVLLANINMLYTYLDKLFLTKSPFTTNISDYVISQNIVMLIVGVISGAISVNIPRLSYYVGINNISAYENLINKGSQLFLFFVIPISFGLMILGTEATLIYGGEKFLTAGIVTSLFAIRSIVWALDNILGVQIMFVRGYEKNLTISIAVGGTINFILNYLLFNNSLFDPVYYITTTIISETVVLLMYILFIKRNQIISIYNILKYALKYSIIASSFIIVSMMINLIYPYNKIINTTTIIIILIKITLCIIVYIIALLILRDKIIIELYNTFKNFLISRRKNS